MSQLTVSIDLELEESEQKSVDEGHTPIWKVYLKKLIRQDSTGIWTVVGYDPIK